MPMEKNVEIPTTNSLQKLRCSVQSYNWGRIGPDTAVAKLYAANSGVAVDPLKPYAEFWMGTHESGPSFVVKKRTILLNPRESQPSDEDVRSAIGDLNGDGHAKSLESTLDEKAVLKVNGDGDCGFETETLKSWIQKNPSVLGDRVLEKWGCDLPFLFKVLSVAKPLSIQAHPDKVLAEELHKLHPNIYKDGNHKPEMAIALTEFEALYGFLEIKEFKDALQRFPEIECMVDKRDKFLEIDDNDDESIKDAVKSLFRGIMSASQDLVSQVLSKMKSRLNLISKDELTPKEQLVLRLEEEYPEDVGVIAAYFMNYVKLKPGQALYLGANELHAYLSGDCFECMATSDNVVRAGLTPKQREVETLCSMLTYNMGVATTLEGIAVNEYTKRYCPPFEEFEVDQCNLPEGKSSTFAMTPGPSIFVVVEGNGKMTTNDHNEEETVSMGDVLFASAMVEVSIKASSEMKLYRAGVNTKFL
ncbi:hypothetical protein V2J09_012611 [Rumex salicifolius]